MEIKKLLSKLKTFEFFNTGPGDSFPVIHLISDGSGYVDWSTKNFKKEFNNLYELLEILESKL